MYKLQTNLKKKSETQHNNYKARTDSQEYSKTKRGTSLMPAWFFPQLQNFVMISSFISFTSLFWPLNFLSFLVLQINVAWIRGSLSVLYTGSCVLECGMFAIQIWQSGDPKYLRLINSARNKLRKGWSWSWGGCGIWQLNRELKFLQVRCAHRHITTMSAKS